MPFTPLHIGPALIIGLPLRRHIHVPTFIVANVILDIEPFIVITYNLSYPLHGYLHTFLGALIVGVALSYFMYALKRLLDEFFRALKLVTDNLKKREYIVAGISGTFLHILLDSPLYSDIKPFYPLPYNPLYNPQITLIIYLICALMLLVGLIMYLTIILWSYLKKYT